MSWRNIRPLQILWQDGIEMDWLAGVFSGMARVLLLADVYNEFIIEPIGQRRHPNYLDGDGYLVPYRSLDWHISWAWRHSKKTGHLNSVLLLETLKKDPTHKANPKYELAAVKEALHWNDDGGLTIGGVSLPGHNALVSLTGFAHFLQPVTGESKEDRQKRNYYFLLGTQMLTMHELGHTFGLFPGKRLKKPTDQELREMHCENECVMYWRIDIERVEKIKNNPFCPSCLENLRKFFIAP